MPRPKKYRCLRFKPNVYYFKPQGIPLSLLEEVILEHDELEALKLHDCDGLDHIQAAKSMKISQSTFARVLDKAYKNLADAIVNGKAIQIVKLPID
ncbi:MAG: DUF134 domain-containing protein [Pseudomonadales bacterium]|nr:DUF134 domain-containing protein [Pseudomonadales bacterium]